MTLRPLAFYRPTQTLSISVTGKYCALKCAHCGGHYLQDMIPLSKLTDSCDLPGRSCLISGGCTLEGKVPFSVFLPKLKALKAQKKYNFHVGLLKEEEIKELASIADVVSFDFVGADSTIHNTLKLPYNVATYLQCFRLLQKYCRCVAPHICLGLEGGKLRGEKNALELLARENIKLLVFIVLRPTPGTEYANVQPPPLEEVQSFLTYARQKLPETRLLLGCMRPSGLYRQKLDAAAVEIGLDGIVQPAASALAAAQSLGRPIKNYLECCVL